jgi:tetratricopeptide (TPR) repeat protein
MLALVVWLAVAAPVSPTDVTAFLEKVRSADEAAARTLVAAQRETAREALDTLLKRFDGSIHSDRQKPEQRLVQYDAESLSLGIRLADAYSRVTGERAYWRRFQARQARLEGTKLLNAQQYRAAVTKLTSALDEAVALEDAWLETITRINLAYGLLELGEPQRALRECERALARAEAVDARARALALFNLASVHLHLRNYPKAAELSEQAAKASRDVGIKIWEGNAELNLSAAYQYLGRKDEAMAALERALAVITQTGDRLGTGRILYGLALLSAERGRYDRAVEYMERALPIIRDVDIRHSHAIEKDPEEYSNPLELSAHELLADAYAKTGDSAKAEAHAARARELRAKGVGPSSHDHAPKK